MDGDNTTFPNWLSKLPQAWNTFAANRVSNIQEILPLENGVYVLTNENPADVASRGTTASQMLKHDLLLNGPSLLSTDKENGRIIHLQLGEFPKYWNQNQL